MVGSFMLVWNALLEYLNMSIGQLHVSKNILINCAYVTAGGSGCS